MTATPLTPRLNCQPHSAASTDTPSPQPSSSSGLVPSRARLTQPPLHPPQPSPRGPRGPSTPRADAAPTLSSVLTWVPGALGTGVPPLSLVFKALGPLVTAEPPYQPQLLPSTLDTSHGQHCVSYLGDPSRQLFVYSSHLLLFIFGCPGSSLLCEGFHCLWQARAPARCSAQASHCGGFSCCGAQALRRRLSSCGAWA